VLTDSGIFYILEYEFAKEENYKDIQKYMRGNTTIDIQLKNLTESNYHANYKRMLQQNAFGPKKGPKNTPYLSYKMVDLHDFSAPERIFSTFGTQTMKNGV
jgi:hypothetical protein